MRILEVIPRFNPKHGGGVNVVYNHSIQMAKRSHQVTVITSDIDRDQEFIEVLNQAGVKVITFHSYLAFALFIYTPGMGHWLRGNIDRFDVVHLNGARSYQNILVTRYAPRFGVPFLIQAHGSIGHIVSRKGIKALYDLVWGKRSFRRSDRFIALTVTEAAMHERMGIPSQKVTVLPNGIDTDRVPIRNRGAFRSSNGISQEAPMVLYVGRLHASKGVDLLIDAFAAMAAQMPGAVLVLAGPDDGQREGLEERVRRSGTTGRVLFLGLVSEEVKFAAMMDADVFVTPRFYGFPITFLECLRTGTPIVTTEAGDGIEGFTEDFGLVTDYSIEGLKEAMARIISDKELGFSIRAKQRQALWKYDWGRISERLEAIYQETTEGHEKEAVDDGE